MSEVYRNVTDYIKGRRTISIGNLCTKFSLSRTDISPIIDTLEEKKEIRIVNSGCTLDCNSCSSCTDKSKPAEKYRDETIVVSLYLKQ